jgi:hypothetical protein
MQAKLLPYVCEPFFDGFDFGIAKGTSQSFHHTLPFAVSLLTLKFVQLSQQFLCECLTPLTKILQPLVRFWENKRNAWWLNGSCQSR